MFVKTLTRQIEQINRTNQSFDLFIDEIERDKKRERERERERERSGRRNTGSWYAAGVVKCMNVHGDSKSTRIICADHEMNTFYFLVIWYFYLEDII